MTNPLAIQLSDELVEEIAKRAAEIVLDQLEEAARPSVWLAGAQSAADYLGVSRARVYKRLTEMPHHRDGARLMFRTDELDRWLNDRREL